MKLDVSYGWQARQEVYRQRRRRYLRRLVIVVLFTLASLYVLRLATLI